MLAVVVLAACGSKAHHASSTTPPTTSPPPPTGIDTSADISVGVPGSPTNWNALAAGVPEAVTDVVDQVWPSAFVVGPDLTPVMNNDLVASATQVSDSPQVVTYQIDPKATWSDGVPITVSDFVYTWEADSGNPAFTDVRGAAFTPASTAGYSQVASVTSPAGQPDTVTVTFSTPDPDWRSLFSPLVPAHIASTVGFDSGFANPVTSVVSGGPYEISSYVPGGEITLARNPDWWGPAGDLASITFQLLSSSTQVAEGLTAGELDAAILDYDPNTVSLLKADSALQVVVGSAAGYDDLVFDLHTLSLQDPVLRQAIMRSVDRVTLGHQASGGAVSPVDNRVFVPSEAGFTEDASNYQGGDASGAQQLLAGAGYTLTGSTLSKAGVPISLTIGSSSGSPFAAAEMKAVEAACAALGIAVAAAPAAVQPDLLVTERPFSAYPSELDGEYATGGTQNVGGYSSSQMDALIARAQSLTAGTARSAVYTQVDQLAWSDGVDLPLLPYPQLIVYQSRYKGLSSTASPAGPAWDAESWNVAAG